MMHAFFERPASGRVSAFRQAREVILALAVLVVCTAGLRLGAQTATGEISITALDATGAVIPGATVTVTGSDTGATVRSLTTNQLGLAPVPLLPPGNYDVSISAQGFKK